MRTQEISTRFTTYFQEQGHALLPSSPLTHPDPTLLFVNSGMVPLKPYFLKQETPPQLNLTSVQKCIRTVDIEEVGKTTRHGTFFQMCGNFSFGGYFRERSIELTWNFLTNSVESGCLGVDPKKLWVTVLEGDLVTKQCWLDLTDVDPNQVQERSGKDNYWSMGVPGPGGPCTEIYYDRGEDYGVGGGPEFNEERFLEIWNIVLMEHELSQVRGKGDVDISGPLPTPCVDTGMGLERVSSVLQGVESIFETDQFYPLVLKLEQVSGRSYREDPDTTQRFRLITDHLRSSLMLMLDGVRPGNSGQSYTLRRLLRRSVRNLHFLTSEENLVPLLLDSLIEPLCPTYLGLLPMRDRLLEVGQKEEHQFRSVLTKGLRILDKELKASPNLVSGEVGFRLNSTLGFPVELTREICEERGFVFDEHHYDRLWQDHREKSRGV